jgi:DNA-binding response OmpR family regulator
MHDDPVPAIPGSHACILIVEDEPRIRELLQQTLAGAGYRCRSCGDLRSAFRELRANLPDLLILDRVLPGGDGLEVLRRLREISPLPVLLLTSLKSEDDKVEGLEAGADDYLAKPFGLRELLARVRALLRRSGREDPPEQVRIGSLRLDLPGRRAWAGGNALSLTPLEFKVLASLACNRGRVLNRDELIELAWGVDYDGYDRAVDTLVKRLRRKLEGQGMPQIRTSRGHGYFLSGGDHP